MESENLPTKSISIDMAKAQVMARFEEGVPASRIVAMVDWKRSTIYSWLKKLEKEKVQREKQVQTKAKIIKKYVLFERAKGQGRHNKISGRAKEIIDKQLAEGGGITVKKVLHSISGIRKMSRET
ncbi:MAG: hypothetical protein GY861_06090, partial [bacterium]|nr:hypothetical protein [bacterium]